MVLAEAVAGVRWTCLNKRGSRQTFLFIEMINKAGNLRRGMLGIEPTPSQVIRLTKSSRSGKEPPTRATHGPQALLGPLAVGGLEELRDCGASDAPAHASRGAAAGRV